jgi:hypothetical protein
LQNAHDRLGSDREIDQILAGAAEKFADDEGTLPCSCAPWPPEPLPGFASLLWRIVG